MLKLINTIFILLVFSITTQANNLDKKQFDLNIAAQSMDKALIQLAENAGVQIIFSANKVENKQSSAVQGKNTLEQALNLLLKNSGLFYETKDNLVLIKEIAKTSLLSQEQENSQVENNNSEDNLEKDNQIVVLGKRVVTRNRTNKVQPELVYDAAYFERFEPLTLNDMLKRVPGVFFNTLFNLPDNSIGSELSNASSELPSFRNLGSQFSQILINGRQPSGVDFGGGKNFLATLPAESIKEIRVVRSPSAEIDSSGVGLTLNVILKDGERYTSNTWRIGAASFDGDIDGVGSVNLAGSTDRFDYNLGLTYQDRRKSGESILDSNTTISLGSNTTSSTVQSNELSTDTNWLASLGFSLGEDGYLKIEGRYFLTDVDASTETNSLSSGFFVDLGITPASGFSATDSELTTENYGLTATYEYYMESLTWNSVVSFDKTDFSSVNKSDQRNVDTNTIDPVSNANARGDAEEYVLNNHFAWRLAETQEIRFGADLKSTSESNFNRQIRFLRIPGFPTPLEINTVFSEDNQDTDRLDLFALYEVSLSENVNLQVGARYESIDYDSRAPDVLIINNDVAAAGFTFNPDIISETTATPFAAEVSGLNPSAHIKWSFAEDHDLRFSLAQTVRRPNINELDPQVSVEYIGDMATLEDARVRYGNPSLENEEASGIDIGYDWHFNDGDGILGLNFYRRDIEDRILIRGQTLEQLAQIRPDLAPEVNRFFTFLTDNNFLFQPVIATTVNTQAGTKAQGGELDLSLPLDFVLANASLFVNMTYSEIETEGETNDYAAAMNISYDHVIESWGLTYGFSYNEITKSESEFNDVLLGSRSRLRELDPNVEIFIEKKWSDSLITRLTVENALDAEDNSVSNSVSPTLTQSNKFVTTSDRRFLLTFRGKF